MIGSYSGDCWLLVMRDCEGMVEIYLGMRVTCDINRLKIMRDELNKK
jgi:hypothetical protein